MKIVIAPDSFKENLTSLEVASELEAGLRRVWPDAEYVKVPMADGGEGTVQSLVDATGGRIVKCAASPARSARRCSPPTACSETGARLSSRWRRPRAFPSFPRLSAIHCAPPRSAPANFVADAIHRGVEEVIIGLGGSATNDGGAGFAQALGVRFIDKDGAPITEPLGGGLLDRGAIDRHALGQSRASPASRSSVACDVTNPLTGEKGASAVYGPQKGATPEMVQMLDRNLAHFAKLIRRDLNKRRRTGFRRWRRWGSRCADCSPSPTPS